MILSFTSKFVANITFLQLSIKDTILTQRTRQPCHSLFRITLKTAPILQKKTVKSKWPVTKKIKKIRSTLRACIGFEKHLNIFWFTFFEDERGGQRQPGCYENRLAARKERYCHVNFVFLSCRCDNCPQNTEAVKALNPGVSSLVNHGAW